MPRGPLTRSERATIERWTRRIARRDRIPGVALGLHRGGRPVYAVGFGYRDRERRIPATPRTIFGLASITKSFTALAVLRLAEQRRLRIEDPVRKYLPAFRTPGAGGGRSIALGHLLSHSSGLPPLPSIYYTGIRSFGDDPPYDPRVARRVGIDPNHAPIETYAGILDYLAHERYRLLGPPGAQFSYSNEGFGLLGAVIESVSGRTYESFVEEEILRPAEMRSTMFDTGILRRQPEVTVLYSPDARHPRRGLVASESWWEDTCLRAAGSLRTNVEDLLRYLEIFVRAGRVGSERIVSAASVRALLRPRVEIRPGQWYGYGIAVQPDYRGTLVAYHSGGLPGISSQFVVVPRRGLASIALANAEQVDAPGIADGAACVLAGWPPRAAFVAPPPRGPLPRSLAEYAGWYCSGEGIWVRLRARRDRLIADFLGIEFTRKGLVLRPRGHDRFSVRLRDQEGLVPFFRDRHGRVAAAQIGWRIVRRRTAAERRAAATHRIVW
jgi:CubicO group peptidase (beta-lactamase class C family)